MTLQTVAHPRSHASLARVLVFSALCVGCASEKTPEEANKTYWSERQERALKDPMNYRPDMKNTDVSGGQTDDFQKDAFKKDMDSLLMK